jgi:hypothetical protein
VWPEQFGARSELDERKRILRMKPLPKAVDVEKAKWKCKWPQFGEPSENTLRPVVVHSYRKSRRTGYPKSPSRRGDGVSPYGRAPLFTVGTKLLPIPL